MSDDFGGGLSKGVIWAIALGLAGLVCFALGVLFKAPGIYILALVLLVACVVIALIKARRSRNG
ncbi:hypothetical protein N865_07450 [Intrasporangium oryzae NRRL B-24470]|uniref:Uncharacterized protein n=1 Tax=Intrasporangium oryzae NRRL B-24470 TaxID=1386089 RepID=W9GD03_9MICO|nr:hypothetical protein [Intrasporangium oryzae]EWT01744.1 hypothetical protein N865_07450 [Intrasporangium oryzae NRRL B-24470]